MPSCVCLQPPCFPMLVPPRHTAFSLPCRLRPVRPPGLSASAALLCLIAVKPSAQSFTSILETVFLVGFFPPRFRFPGKTAVLFSAFLTMLTVAHVRSVQQQ